MESGRQPHGAANRIAELDALRGIAALIVLLAHFTAAYDVEVTGQGSKSDYWTWYGRYGVHLFFIISGYVILMTLERTRSAGEFAVARAVRLLPAYYVCALITLGLIQASGFNPYRVEAADVPANLVMMAGFFGRKSIDPVYWTLLHEVFFYALAAFCHFVLKIRRYEIACLVWLTASMAAQMAGHRSGFGILFIPWKLETALGLYFCFLFAAGMMLYLIVQGRSNRLTHAVLALCLIQAAYHEGPSVGLICAAFALVIWLAATGRLRALRHPALVFFGAISYPLYLVHQTLGFWIIRTADEGGLPHALGLALAAAAAVALAWTIRVVVELPTQRAIRNWRLSRATLGSVRDSAKAPA